MTHPSPPTGQRLGATWRPEDVAIHGYQILGEIHRGGQGVVYKAIQEATRRVVALKVLLHESFASEQSRQRFEREIQLVAGLGHPNIVTVYDSGLAKGCYYFAMEYIEGQRLNEYFAGPQRGAVETLALMRRISAAVGYAHGRGVVHRDLKPGNILIDSEGRPHIVDFGLAKAAKSAHRPDKPTLTEPGDVMGTPSYMAPEQFRGEPALVDARCDVYALGVIIYECLTGRLPREADWVMTALVTGEVDSASSPPAPSRLRRDLDSAIDTMTLKCLAMAPDRRYADAQELADELDRYLAGQPILAKRSSLVYRGRTTLRRNVSRHPISSYLLVWLVGLLVGDALVRSGALVRHPDRWFESQLQTALRPSGSDGWAKEVVVVALDDASFEAIPSLAAAEGLEQVTQGSLVSWRRLHGKFMERLARAGPAVVVWDIVFRSSQPAHDPYLVDGIDALRAGGAKVVVGVAAVDRGRRPQLSPAVASAVDGWGWITLFKSSGRIRKGMLAVTHPPDAPAFSLSLAAFAAWKHPQCKPIIVWEGDNYWLTVTYANRAEDGQGRGQMISESDHILIGDTRTKWEKSIPDGVDISDRNVSMTWVVVRDENVQAEHTISYRNLFSMSDDALHNRLAGKIVLIGDTRDRHHKSPDKGMVDDGRGGREEFHVYVHAAALCDRLANVQLRRPGKGGEVALIALFAGTGVIFGAGLGRRRRVAAWMAATFIGVVFPLVCFGVAAGWGVIASPATAVLTGWLTLAGAIWVTHTASGLGLKLSSSKTSSKGSGLSVTTE